MALGGINALLSDFGLSDAERLVMMKSLSRGFSHELRVGSIFAQALGARFRRERDSISSLLDLGDDPDHPLAPGFDILRERSANLQPLVKELRTLERDGKLTLPIVQLVPSFIHMHVNRLLRSAARAHELVLYDFLGRVYQSRIARQTHGGDSAADEAQPADVDTRLSQQ